MLSGTSLKHAVRISEWVQKGSYVQANVHKNIWGILWYGYICINAFWTILKKNWGTLVCEVPYGCIYTVPVGSPPLPYAPYPPPGVHYLSSMVSEEAMTAKRIAVRLNKFIKDERFRQIVTGENELDIADIVKNKRVIIVDTSGMSLDKRIYITSLFSFAIKFYCEFQKQSEFKLLMFYLDECWMGINDSFDFLLTFSRSFNVGLTLAHQNIHQFPDYKTVKKNFSICNTKVAFLPAGNEEARLMAEIYGLEQADFRDLEEYEAWVRIGNQNSLVKTYPPPEPEKTEMPTAEIVPEMEIMGKPSINFLRDCWFSC